MPYNPQEHELDVLKYWKDKDVFNRSVSERPADKPYVFYDGPPFATGLPHYGHIVGSVMKDVVPRYQTMKGHRVERVWGWDCHGLPIENIVEKELGTKSKQEIEELGVDVFNEKCRTKILSYVDDWEKVVTRLGRWVDMKNAYRTMDTPYMESIWWVFKQLWEKDLIYKGYKPMHICPRCETTLSQQEVSEGYKDVKDLSVTAQFKVVDKKEALQDIEGDIYFLAWTTTPWTLPGNVLIAVGADVEYAVVKLEDAHYIVAKDLVMKNFEGKEFEVMGHASGSDLVGMVYEPLFPYFADSENSFRVVTADFVTTEDGTGLVHLAPAFGTDDYEVFKQENVPFIQHVKMNGRFTDDVTDFAGMHVKPQDDHMKTDIEIIKWLAHNGKLFSKKKYEHSYPHCWRCDTPLINYATSSWFVAVTKVKADALEQAKKINWSPSHMKEGRFGNWLAGARDWSISRQRFWASVMPVWECTENPEKCERKVMGSIAELEAASGVKVDDLHKHIVDEVVFACDCGGEMKRIPDVLDTWFDSGSMPYAQVHYPFENEEKFEAGFPAKFIAEGDDQTRAWFYYLHVLSTAIKGTPAYENVIVNGIALAEDGKKMSKKLRNYPDPMGVLEKYGADALRYYLMSSPIVSAENLSFSEVGVREVFNKVVNTLSNVVVFYELFAGEITPAADSTHVLDAWIITRLDELTVTVTTEMDAYRLAEASRPIMDFILDLSQWYVRRSRDRMKGSDKADAAACLGTLETVLKRLAVLMAPFTPFIAEQVWQKVHAEDEAESVHLERWPNEMPKVDSAALLQMTRVRKMVEYGLSLRKDAKVKVRQPLGQFVYTGEALDTAYESIIAEELNVKKVAHATELQSGWEIREEVDMHVALDLTMTEELKKEGLLRELIRSVNGKRKAQGLTRDARVHVTVQTESAMVQEVVDTYKDAFASAVLADSITLGDADAEEEVLNGERLHISVTK
ncbi:MAG: isoleucine--tRNA ligase [Candidatus Magasanikbacteria bacterium]|nr:isoleucine--tRNA ligase [Candidatus Magasanikbacteria bacterium]